MISGIQFLGVVFILIQSYFTFLNYKRQEFTWREALGWWLVWLFFGLVTVFPNQFHVLAGNFGALRTLDFFTIAGFMVVLSISFYTYIHLDRLRRRLEATIRALALKDLDDK